MIIILKDNQLYRDYSTVLGWFELGLKRIYRIFEYSFEMIERIFVRLETIIRLETNVRLETNIRMETNICLLLMDNYTIFVFIGGIENIYSYLNCILLANLCLRKLFPTIWSLEIELMLSHQNERIFECSFV